MSDPQGLKSAHIEATGTAVTGAFYLKGYQCISGGTAGEIIFRDGGVSGNIMLNLISEPAHSLLV